MSRKRKASNFSPSSLTLSGSYPVISESLQGFLTCAPSSLLNLHCLLSHHGLVLRSERHHPWRAQTLSIELLKGSATVFSIPLHTPNLSISKRLPSHRPLPPVQTSVWHIPPRVHQYRHLTNHTWLSVGSDRNDNAQSENKVLNQST